jgi:hypothetical protein
MAVSEAISDDHAFKERRNMNPVDDRLRRAGFRIKFRPSNGPAIWECRVDGKWVEFTQAAAVATIDAALHHAKESGKCSAS